MTSKGDPLSVNVFALSGKDAGLDRLPKEVFGQTPNKDLLAQAIRVYQYNVHPKTAHTKTRGEVRGGGAKPWRQKGTGRARAGSNTSPIWVGGGRTFGPFQRNWKTTLPKKISRLALKSALSSKASEDKIKVLEELSLEQPKTKTIYALLQKLGISGSKILFLGDARKDNLCKSCRNIKNLTFRPAQVVNPYDLLNCEYLLLTRDSLKKLEEVFSS